jgi:flagellar hook-associated protein 2
MATTTPTLSSPGIGSGLDVQGIVDKLMTVERAPLDQLTTKETTVQSQVSAYGSLKSSLATLQTAVQALATPTPFRSMNATAGDMSVVSVATADGAKPGRYSLEVSQLAQNQKLVSAGYAATSDTVGSGSLTFTFGTFASGTFTPNATAGARTVTIASGQSSLAGIRDAVNAANIGVTATILNDGSANGQRLVFTSNNPGADQSLSVSVADDDGNGTDANGLSALAYDPAATAGAGKNLTQTVAAQDALFTLDGLSMRSSSNTVANAVAGLTLTLGKTNVGSPTAINVSQNIGPAGAAVAAFVKAYNDLDTTIDNLTKYDAVNKKASILTGDSTVRLVQTQLRSLVGGMVSGSGSLTTLSQIGITTQSDGTLAFDSAKFNTAFAADPDGVSQLFAATGSASDSLVSYAGAGSKTVAGTYDVNVTQLATQGLLAGSAAPGLAITAGVNDTLTATVDGVPVTVTLTAGNYASAAALAAEIASKVNGALDSGTSGGAITVDASGGVLGVTSSRYGSTSAVAFSGTAADTIMGTSPTATVGLDAAGTIGGVPALGSGQTLLGATGSAAEGLQINITGGALGARGTVTYAQGMAYRLSQTLSALLASDGAVQARTDGLQSSITDMDKRKDVLQARLDTVQAAYLRQFNALDTQLAQMQSLSTYLTQQLASLPKIGDSSK